MSLKATHDISHSLIQQEKDDIELDDDVDGDLDIDGLSLSIQLSGSEDENNDESHYGSPISYYPSSQRAGFQVCLASVDSDTDYSNDTNRKNQDYLGSNASDDDYDDNTSKQKWSASLVGNKICLTNTNNIKSQQQQQDADVTEDLQVNSMAPLATLADINPLFHYYQELCQHNVDSMNLHQGIVGDKARIQKTSKVNVNPVSHSLRSAAIAAVKKFIPSIEDDPQSQSLIKNVTRAAARMCPPLDDRSNFLEYEAAIGTICQQIHKIFPQRALFNLMSRWARRSKNHFQRDAFNVVRVLSDQINMSPVQFLDKARTWVYSPPTNTRKNMMVSYVRLNDNEIAYDSVVGQLHVCCMMMDSSLHGLEDITFARSRMSSVNEHTNFCLSVGDDDDLDSAPQTISTPPVQGFHLLRSFEKRIWLEVDHLHSGYILLQLIFEPLLVTKKIYQSTNPKEMVMSFLIQITDTSQRRPDFVQVLAKIALYFLTSDVSTTEAKSSNNHVISKLIDRRSTFVSEINQRTCHLNPLSIIINVKEFLSRKGKKGKFKLRLKGNNQQKRNQDCLNLVSMSIFTHWLKFDAQKKLKKELDSLTNGKKSRKRKHSPNVATCTLKIAYKKSTCHLQNCLAKKLPTMTSQLEYKSPVPSSTTSTSEPSSTIDTGTTHNIPSPVETDYAVLSKDDSRWEGCCGIVPQSILNDKVTSSFYIQMPSYVYELVSSPFDIYSAGFLVNKNHWRTTVPPRMNTFSTTTVHIPQDQSEFRDMEQDVLHVARNGSQIMKKFLPKYSILLIPLVRFVMLHGEGDKKRKEGKGKILNLGVNAEYDDQKETNYKVKGQAAFDVLPDQEQHEILRSIGQLADLLWDVMNEFQLLSNLPPIGGTSTRDKLFASVLRSYIFAEKMEFEWITLSVIILWPNLLGCVEHLDSKNSLFHRYSKTGAANFVVSDLKGNLYLLQVIVNFRRKNDLRIIKHKKHIDVIVANIIKWTTDLKLKYWKHCAMYTGMPETVSFVKDPFDMSDFCLHNTSPYIQYDIGTSANPILGNYVVLPIGVSRTLSLSSMIAAIYKHVDYLKTDQIIELCFIGACLNSTMRFHEVMWNASKDDLMKHKHPFKFWIKRTLTLFDNQWQGGPLPRFVSMGETTTTFLAYFVPKSMLSKDGLLAEEYGMEEGNVGNDVALMKITEALAEHVRWINSLLGMHKAEDIPYSCILNQMEVTLKKVKKAAFGSGLEFDLFRLQIFTELISALAIPEPGPHLLQLMIPASENQRSYKHLSNPLIHKLSDVEASQMSSGSEGRSSATIPTVIPVAQFDPCCSEVSTVIGRPFYRRNHIESCLCESLGISFRKEESYAKDITLHNLHDTGYPVLKEYGRESIWMATKRPNKDFAFLTIEPLQDTITT